MELTRKPADPALPLAADALVRRLRRIRHGALEVESAGQRLTLTGPFAGPTGHIRLLRPARLMARLALRGDIGFAESYMAGDWDSDDLPVLLWLLAENQAELAASAEAGPLARLAGRVRHALNGNSRRGSRRNIAYHYDLGNDFYRLWLDAGMTYSAASFDQPGLDLAAAQDRKYERLLAMTGARRGDHLLEIGCGWGGFAETAARRGMQLTGLTLSTEQLAWARRRLDAARLGQQVELRLQDYRDVSGSFDHIVSIEMFEAVGEAYWSTYMARLKELLKPGGTAALQVIVIEPGAFAAYRRRPDFIQRYIFPGGMLPSVPVFDRVAAQAGLRVTAREYGGLDYAHTLAAWRDAFHARLDAVRKQGYDEHFCRMWDYYLAYCEAGFRSGRIDLMRVALQVAD